MELLFKLKRFDFYLIEILLLILTNQTSELEESISKIKIKDKWFVDEHNRVVLFHGINAIRKEFPWIPNKKEQDMTNDTQLFNLKKWGFNTVRLGIMWSGIMPEKNRINQTYLDQMTNIVDKLALYGIYVIIDLHQDMMSSKFNSYDGVPKWILDELPKSKFDFPWPLKNSTLNLSVFAAYITESCGFAFQCLYDNVNKFADYFQDYWIIVAKIFSNKKNILGYELLNEPWAGNVYANPLLLLPGIAGSKNLLKLYDRTFETIRKYDQNALIFYEPVTWGVLLNRNYFGTGFNRPPGNDHQTTVFSWHYYCWFLSFKENPLINGTYPELEKILCDDIQLKISFESVKLDMLELGGGPSFLTEFGECAFRKDDLSFNVDECKAVLDQSDKNFQSWCYWDSYFYELNTLKEIPELIDLFSRVYPKATNGIPIRYSFNLTSKEFFYQYKMNITSLKQAQVPTEIHIPTDIYSNGFYCKIPSFLKCINDEENFRVLILLNDKSLKNFVNFSNFLFEKTVQISINSI